MTQDHLFPGGKTVEERLGELRARIERYPEEQLFAKVPYALISDVTKHGAPKDALRVYCLLSALVGRDGTTKREKSLMAALLKIGDTTFRKSAAWLEAQGYLDRVHAPPRPAIWIVKEVAGYDGATIYRGSSTDHPRSVNRPPTVDQPTTHGRREETPLRGEQPFGLGAAPPAWSVSDFESILKAWPGRVNPSEARGRFFQLGKTVDWAVHGERGLHDRLRFFCECYEKLGWALPPLQAVLWHEQGKLLDQNLEGLEGDAKRAKERRA